MSGAGWTTIPVHAQRNMFTDTCIACGGVVNPNEGYCWRNVMSMRWDVQHNICDVYRPAPSYVISGGSGYASAGVSAGGCGSGAVSAEDLLRWSPSQATINDLRNTTTKETEHMRLFEYAVVSYARDDNGNVQRNKATVLTSPTSLLAHDENEVRRTAVKALPDGTDLSDDALDIIVVPFGGTGRY